VTKNDHKREVQQFYDEIGWQIVDGELYQNARYEDLRPVSREYIHRCHLRAGRPLKQIGCFFLDAGSGPVQYPEYLTYSENYETRVCLDISIVALQEARKRLGEKSLYVVGDVAHLPFAPEIFDGLNSMHTLHHISVDDQLRAYDEFFRVLAHASVAVVVNGWQVAPLMVHWAPVVHFAERVDGFLKRFQRQEIELKSEKPIQKVAKTDNKEQQPTGTFVRKTDAAWLRENLSGRMNLEILVWRSVNVRWLRALIHPGLGGKLWLRLLYWLEERRPHYYGERGQYPLIIIRKD
jgi:ubiquinone/menaquinone biosynthesis C-methylase UbiE